MKRQSLFVFKKLGYVHFSIQKFSNKIAPRYPIQAQTKHPYYRNFSTVNNIPVKDASEESNTTTKIAEIFQKIPLTALFQSTKNSAQLKNAMKLIQEDISEINKNIRDTLIGKIPLLNSVSTYYFEHEGKKFRPALVLLISQAIENHLNWLKGETIDQQIHCKRAKKEQLILAEVIEMIHTASIVHDDVLDDATIRRGQESINAKHSNKIAILCGDYLLAKASLHVNVIKNPRVTQLISEILVDLVEGEFMQLDKALDFEKYLQKTYNKTASLMANSCCAAAIIAGASEEIIKAARDYGKFVGLAFQLTDDLLDITSSTSLLGKPAAVDLQLGLITAPVYFAMKEFPEILPIAERQFSQAGDIEKVLSLVKKSSAIVQTQNLVAQYCLLAEKAISLLASSPASRALADIPSIVQHRSK